MTKMYNKSNFNKLSALYSLRDKLCFLQKFYDSAIVKASEMYVESQMKLKEVEDFITHEML